MKLSYFVVGMMLSGSLAAQDVRITGTISQTIKEPASKIQGVKTFKKNPGKIKEIKLMKVQLSDKARKALAARSSQALAHTGQFAVRSIPGNPSAVSLGMNDVPVLDQGQHGSCVTFAATGAVNAILGKGDYISQLCQLQLGNYLEQHGYGFSGWDGSFGRFVLGQIDTFGIVNKAMEAQHGCGGISKYPLLEVQPVSNITVEEYRHISEPVSFENFYWTPILDTFQAFSDRINTSKTLDEVKTSLIAGDRVIFGALLVDPHLGLAGAVGQKKVENDTWVLTPEIARSAYMNQLLAGHEMIITGYNDKAIATDEQGRQHKGLLTLRNSWGDKFGDQGNFYMSYDYFMFMVMEAQRVRHVPDEQEDVDRA